MHWDADEMWTVLPSGLFVCIFKGVVGQGGFVACVLHHVVPCDKPLAYRCAPRFKALRKYTHTMGDGKKQDL